jgi:ribose transport system substrate-binding protein
VIPSVLTDTDPLVYKAVKAGYATGTMVSNAYAQAYLASASLKLMSQGCKFKDPKKYVYGIPYAFVGAKGVATVTQTLVANAKKIGKTWKSDFWTCP